MALIKYVKTFVQANHVLTSYDGPIVPPEPPDPPEENYYKLTNRGRNTITLTIHSSTRGNVFVGGEWYGFFQANQDFEVEVPGRTEILITGLSGESAITSGSENNNISLDRFDESANPEGVFKEFDGLKEVTSWNGAENYTSLADTFEGSTLTTIPSSWEGLENLTDISDAFRDTDITEIPSSYNGLDSVTDFSGAFANCSELVSGGDSGLEHMTIESNTSNMFIGDSSWEGNAQAIYDHLSTVTENRDGMFGGCVSATGYDNIPVNPWGGGNDGITGEYTLIRNIGKTTLQIKTSGYAEEEVYINGIKATSLLVRLNPGDSLKVFNMHTWYYPSYEGELPKLSIDRFGSGYYYFYLRDFSQFFTKITTWEGCYNANSVSTGRLRFVDWENLESIPNSWDGLCYKDPQGTETVTLTYAESLFRNCHKLKNIPNTWEGLKVDTLSRAFQYCTSLEEIPESWLTLDSSMIGSSFKFNNTFEGCTSLKRGGSIGFERIAQIKDVRYMFDGCINWEGTDVNAFRMTLKNNYSGSPTTNQYIYAFGNCYKADNFDQLPHIWSRTIPQDVLASNNYEEIVGGPTVDDIGTVVEIVGSSDDNDFGVFIENGEVVEALPLGHNNTTRTTLAAQETSAGYFRTIKEGEILRLYSTSGDLYILTNGGYRLDSDHPAGELSVTKFNPARGRTIKERAPKLFTCYNYSPYSIYRLGPLEDYITVRIKSWTGTNTLLNMGGFFHEIRIIEIPNSWNNFGAKIMEGIFGGCKELTTIPNSWAGLENVYDISEAFQDTSITAIPDSWEGLDSVTNSYVSEYGDWLDGMNYAFVGTKITYIPELNTSNKFLNFYSTFSKIDTLTEVSWTFEHADDVFHYMPNFSGCRNLKRFSISANEGTAYIYCYQAAFQGCNNLETVNFSDSIRIDSSGRYCGQVFQACRSLTNAYSLYRDKGFNGNLAFEGCISDPNYSLLPSNTRGQDEYGYKFKYTFYNVDSNFNPNTDIFGYYGYWAHESGNTWSIYVKSVESARTNYGIILIEDRPLPDGITYRIEEINVYGNFGTSDYMVAREYCSLESVSETACQTIGQLFKSQVKFYECESLRILPIIRYTQFSQTDIDLLYGYCPNVESNIIAAYEYLSSLPSITNHKRTFYDCGTNTESGAAELAQIPDDWKRAY